MGKPEQEWIVEYYTDRNGFSPVKDYIRKLTDPKQVAVVMKAIMRLKALGTEIQQTKMDKFIEDSIRELRKDRHRVLYGRIGNVFVLLTAFLKETDQTPESEKQLARTRFQDYKDKHSKQKK